MGTTAGEIVEYLKGIGIECKTLGSPQATASRVVDLDDAEPDTLSWRRDWAPTGLWFGSILLAPPTGSAKIDDGFQAIVFCDNPRLAFFKVVTQFFEHQWREGCIPVVAPSTNIHRTAVIGEEGQGYEWDAHEGKHVSMPHLAGVVIGPDVTIGPHSTVKRGVLRDTHIGRGTKIGNGVNVGHGVAIGEHCIIVAHATIGGSTRIGNNVKIWQGAMIANNVRIGSDAVIGMGAVVLDDVPEGETWVGNPARKIR